LSAAPRAADHARLLLLAVVWSSSFITMKLAAETIPPATVTAARIVLAALILYPIMRAQGHRLPRDGRTWLLFLGIALAGNSLPFLLITEGLAHVDSGTGAILMAAVPLCAVLMAHALVPGERLTWRSLGGVAVGYAGVAAMVGPAALAQSSMTLGETAGAQAAILGGAVLYALAAVLARRLPPMPPEVPGTGVMLAAAAVSLPLAFLLDDPMALRPHADSIIATVVLGLVPTAFASILFFRLAAATSATYLAMTNYLVPVLGVAWGALLLDEHFGGSEAVALALILAGVWLVGRRER